MSIVVLENCELAGSFLLLPLVVKTQDSFVHNPSKHCHLLYLLLFGHSPQFVLECYGNFRFEKSFLLLATHITTVPKLIDFVKFWNFDFGTGFGTLFRA